MRGYRSSASRRPSRAAKRGRGADRRGISRQLEAPDVGAVVASSPRELLDTYPVTRRSHPFSVRTGSPPTAPALRCRHRRPGTGAATATAATATATRRSARLSPPRTSGSGRRQAHPGRPPHRRCGARTTAPAPVPPPLRRCPTNTAVRRRPRPRSRTVVATARIGCGSRVAGPPGQATAPTLWSPHHRPGTGAATDTPVPHQYGGAATATAARVRTAVGPANRVRRQGGPPTRAGHRTDVVEPAPPPRHRHGHQYAGAPPTRRCGHAGGTHGARVRPAIGPHESGAAAGRPTRAGRRTDVVEPAPPPRHRSRATNYGGAPPIRRCGHGHGRAGPHGRRPRKSGAAAGGQPTRAGHRTDVLEPAPPPRHLCGHRYAGAAADGRRYTLLNDSMIILPELSAVMTNR